MIKGLLFLGSADAGEIAGRGDYSQLTAEVEKG